MIKVHLYDNNPAIDAIPYDKITTSIKDGILTVTAERTKQPSGKKVKLTVKTSSFAVFTEK